MIIVNIMKNFRNAFIGSKIAIEIYQHQFSLNIKYQQVLPTPFMKSRSSFQNCIICSKYKLMTFIFISYFYGQWKQRYIDYTLERKYVKVICIWTRIWFRETNSSTDDREKSYILKVPFLICYVTEETGKNIHKRSIFSVLHHCKSF